MPTITLRLDDDVKAELDAIARGRGQSLSGVIRSAIDGLLMRDEGRGDVVALTSPRSLTLVERQQLVLLHRILARLRDGDGAEDAGWEASEHQRQLVTILEHGFADEYHAEFSLLWPELDERDSAYVIDVLELFRVVYFSMDRLETPMDDDLVSRLRFRGFDANDPHEARFLSYARHLIGEGRWRELRESFSELEDEGNSHMPTTAWYSALLAEHGRIVADKRTDPLMHDHWLLNADELRRLAGVRLE